MTDEEKKSISFKVDLLAKEVQKITDALLGTLEKKGIINQHHENTSWIKKQKESKESLVLHAYRVVIAIILAYIAVNIGLK